MSFISHWTAIAAALDLDIQGPIEIALPDGKILKASVFLKNFGAERGILLFECGKEDWHRGDFWGATSALTGMGYGCSVFGPYRDDEQVDLDAAKEVLADWQWTGPTDQTPPWLQEPQENEDAVDASGEG